MKGQHSRIGRIFNNEGQITEDALAICRKLGVDPQSLFARSPETFGSIDTDKNVLMKAYQNYEQERQRNTQSIQMHLNIYAQHASNNAQNRKRGDALANLTMRPEEKRLNNSASKISPYKTSYMTDHYQTVQNQFENNSFAINPYTQQQKGDRDRQRWLEVMQNKERNQSATLANRREKLFKMFEKEDEKKRDIRMDNQQGIKDLEKKQEKYRSVIDRREQREKALKSDWDNKEVRYRSRVKRLDEFRRDPSIKENRLQELQSRYIFCSEIDEEYERTTNARSDRARTANPSHRLVNGRQSKGSIQDQLVYFDQKNNKAETLKKSFIEARVQTAGKNAQKFDEKKAWKESNLAQEQYDVFNKNTLKRKKIKDRLIEYRDLKRIDFEHKETQKEQKMEKLRSTWKACQDAQKNKMTEIKNKHQRMERNLSNGRKVMNDHQQLKLQKDQIMSEIQQKNANRNKKMLNDYKVKLVEDLQQKEMRKQMIEDRKKQVVAIALKSSANIRNQFFYNRMSESAQPLSYENYESEFKIVQKKKKKPTELL